MELLKSSKTKHDQSLELFGEEKSVWKPESRMCLHNVFQVYLRCQYYFTPSCFYFNKNIFLPKTLAPKLKDEFKFSNVSRGKQFTKISLQKTCSWNENDLLNSLICKSISYHSAQFIGNNLRHKNLRRKCNQLS